MHAHAHAELTFILLAGAGEGTDVTPEEVLLPAGATTTTKQPLGLQMIGDANLFLKGTPGEDEFEAEVEIMIAGERSCIVLAMGDGPRVHTSSRHTLTDQRAPLSRSRS